METEKTKTVISSDNLSIGAYFSEIIKYRHLLSVFALQEIKAMYAQTYLGIMWAIIRPLFILSVFTVIFKLLLNVHTQSPYYLFAFAGMMSWNFFSQVATLGSTAIIQRQSLIRKMYFPKLILPVSKVLIAGVDLLVSLTLFFAFLAYERIPVTACILALPLFVFLNIACGLAVAVWMSATNIKFRDLNQIVAAIIGVAIWVTPVFYPVTIIPKGYEFFVYINPMAGIIKGYRFALLGEGFPEWQYWGAMFTVVVLMLAGIFYLSKVEDKIIDYA